MSGHAMPMEGREQGDGVEKPRYEMSFEEAAGLPIPERILPTEPVGGLVDYSQLPPPAVDHTGAPIEPSLPGFTPAPVAASGLLAPVTDLPAADLPLPGAPVAASPSAEPLLPVPPSATSVPSPAPLPLSDPLTSFPGLTMPEAMPGFATPESMTGFAAPESIPGLTLPDAMPGFTMPSAPSIPIVELEDMPAFEVLPPGSSRTGASRRRERAFIDDEYTAAARERVDAELIDALEAVVNEGASDLHVTINSAPMIRVDGGLRPVPGTGVWDREQVASALYSLMSDEQRAQFDEHLELDFAFTLSEQSRFRVNYYLQRGAIGGAFRLIPTKIKPLADLGVPPVVSGFAKLPRGLVLVTGPTGSGKSTTLAALVDLVNQTRSDHIVTVEDPIEFMHSNKKAVVNQREVGNDTHSFANALKHVLRQDPDVILIGELRDLETISVALTAAETGHLVFATLHTQDAGSTVDRVIDVFPPHQQDQVRTQLAAVLQGVVCQTLVKHSSGEGRVVATEVMMATPAIANLIREGKTYQIASVLQSGGQQGMHSMDQRLAELVDAGEITREAAFEKAHDPETLTRLIQRVAPTARMQSPDEIAFAAQMKG